MMLWVKAESKLISSVRQGLEGKSDCSYYGFPFAGDNNFLFDRIDYLENSLLTHWFVQSDSNLELEPGAVSLTVEIDRQNPSQTKSLLFSATQHPFTSLPDSQWLSIFESSQ